MELDGVGEDCSNQVGVCVITIGGDLRFRLVEFAVVQLTAPFFRVEHVTSYYFAYIIAKSRH